MILRKVVEELPPAAVNEVAIFRHTVFIDGPAAGLASTVTSGGCLRPVADLGRLHEKNTAELARRLFSDHPLERAIGMAAVNAVVNDPEKIPAGSGANAFSYIEEHGRGANVAVIGHFPKVDQLRHSGLFENFWVFELNPQGDDLGPDQYEAILPRADFVLLTATSLINDSFTRLIDLCRQSFNILLGPSTPLHPVFFDHGIDCLAGSVVSDRRLARGSLSQGASFRHSQGLRQVTWFKADPGLP
ncbi:MAG: DUF364 domain-containing protein [Deltaproteobacteria bacterium]|nr:DUF364 domain-containing protein [Deltaproteobacteria bacterium]